MTCEATPLLRQSYGVGGILDWIQVTRAVYEQLKDKFTFEPRWPTEVKGKGSVDARLLTL